MSIWVELPFEVLSKIFSFLGPDSLACASSTCRLWHHCSKSTTLVNDQSNWFVAFPTRNNLNSLSCYTQNPVTEKWHSISLSFLPCPVKPLTSVDCLILFRAITATNHLELIVSNPFTREFKRLPSPAAPRTNPAVGVVTSPRGGGFRVYVAGGTRGSEYDPALEVYDTADGAWRVVGQVPAEIAVRLTVWTPSDGAVHCDGWLYWITSARAYSLIGLDVGMGTWRTWRVPMAERLEFAAVVRRLGRVAVVGGACGGEAHVWELDGGSRDGGWLWARKVPPELGETFVGEKGSWASTKCVSGEGVVCLYGGLGSGMVVWRERQAKWEWVWVEGCRFVGGKRVPDFKTKALFLQPNLSSSTLFSL